MGEGESKIGAIVDAVVAAGTAGLPPECRRMTSGRRGRARSRALRDDPPGSEACPEGVVVANEPTGEETTTFGATAVGAALAWAWAGEGPSDFGAEEAYPVDWRCVVGSAELPMVEAMTVTVGRGPRMVVFMLGRGGKGCLGREEVEEEDAGPRWPVRLGAGSRADADVGGEAIGRVDAAPAAAEIGRWLVRECLVPAERKLTETRWTTGSIVRKGGGEGGA